MIKSLYSLPSHIINLINSNSMCFLKAFKQLDAIPIEKGHESAEGDSGENLKAEKENHSFLNKILETRTPVLFTRQDQILFNLLNHINANTKHLRVLDEKLTFNEQHLASSLDQLATMEEESPFLKACSDTSDLSHGETAQEEPGTLVDPLVEKMFGPKRYQYKLQLQGDTPSVIYKERNINISVTLTNQQNQKVLNSNIVHLCLGVADINGEWITENKAKENFMKGKTEVQLYHGEGSFLKVYPREVSRHYPDSKVNFIVYAKPSVLKFSSNNSLVEKEVDSNLIEPLLLKDIYIKAKKKE